MCIYFLATVSLLDYSSETNNYISLFFFLPVKSKEKSKVIKLNPHIYIIFSLSIPFFFFLVDIGAGSISWLFMVLQQTLTNIGTQVSLLSDHLDSLRLIVRSALGGSFLCLLRAFPFLFYCHTILSYTS